MVDTKMCPYCGEDIKIEAIKCKHCQSLISKEDDRLVGAAAPVNTKHAPPKKNKPIWMLWWVWALIAVLFIAILVSGRSNDKEPAAEPEEVVEEAKEGEMGEIVGQEEQTAQAQDNDQQADETKAVPAPEPEITEYDLSINAQHLGGRSFKVAGTTSLPNGSEIGIIIRDIDYFKHDDADDDWRFENLTYIGASETLQGGKFSKTISVNEMLAPLKSDQYTVEVTFNPRRQNDRIKNIVGANGEYLSGGNLDKSIEGLVMIRASIVISLVP